MGTVVMLGIYEVYIIHVVLVELLQRLPLQLYRNSCWLLLLTVTDRKLPLICALVT